LPDQQPDSCGPVLITGTSTGIGAASAIHFAQKGFHVFAGVRRTADGAALKARAPYTLEAGLAPYENHLGLGTGG
jgi:NAD(P)-dependent dehydrogenase (short-subunit alcohol dehydrogenase family)